MIPLNYIMGIKCKISKVSFIYLLCLFYAFWFLDCITFCVGNLTCEPLNHLLPIGFDLLSLLLKISGAKKQYSESNWLNRCLSSDGILRSVRFVSKENMIFCEIVTNDLEFCWAIFICIKLMKYMRNIIWQKMKATM